jgi:hypothetical protein
MMQAILWWAEDERKTATMRRMLERQSTCIPKAGGTKVRAVREVRQGRRKNNPHDLFVTLKE